jgi:carbonic anhydrase
MILRFEGNWIILPPMEDLIAGYKRFRAYGWQERQKEFEELAGERQHPKALVISCIDSRVEPAIIFDAMPGEMIVVRNVANLVPPYGPDASYHGTSAALEFGVRVLEVPHIIVMGHEMCGGVKALLEGAPETAKDYVEPWMSLAASARVVALRQGSRAERQRCCEHEVVKVSLTNLLTFPWIAEWVASGKLALHGAWFNIHSGELNILQPDGTFQPVPDSPFRQITLTGI